MDLTLQLVENIDNLAVKAEHMPLTKIQFIDCLREVTRQKILQVKQAKDIPVLFM